MVHVPYESVWIELKELVAQDDISMPLTGSVTDFGYPLDNLEAVMGLCKSDVFRWGQWWNLDFLESEKHEIRVKYRCLALDRQMRGLTRAHAWYSFLIWLSKRNWFLEVCFWSKNLFTARHLRRTLEAYLRGSS